MEITEKLSIMSKKMPKIRKMGIKAEIKNIRGPVYKIRKKRIIDTPRAPILISISLKVVANSLLYVIKRY